MLSPKCPKNLTLMALLVGDAEIKEAGILE
jgi:hypothetical protein